LVQLIAVFVRRCLAQDEAILEPIEKDRIGLLGHKNNRVVIGGLYLHDVFEIGGLQALLIGLYPVEGEDDVFGRKRRAVVEADSSPKAKHQMSSLIFGPGSGRLT
jgi:hypothetical protein